MSSFSKALAHHGDRLPVHLESVAGDAVQRLEGAPDRCRTAALLMGLIHDAGKATPWFQDYLHGEEKRSKRTRHSLLGAVLAHHVLAAAGNEEIASSWMHWTVVGGIARHHGDFFEDLKTTLTNLKDDARASDALRDQLEVFDGEGFRAWIETQFETRGIVFTVPTFGIEEILESVSSFHPSFEDPFTDLADGFDFLAAFGAFVGADKMHTAHPDWERDPETIPPGIVQAFKEQEFGSPGNDLNRQREEIFDEVQTTLENGEDDWLYTLTAPTGSGKTLTGLAAGLQLKERKTTQESTSRLVYCLPFTSVIDQNSSVYEDVLETRGLDADDQLLLKHHHLADPRYRKGEEEIVDGSDLLVETWESEIVVTTFYQLVHTLFTSRNKNLKRFTALRNAVVVLDEVQAIPHEHWGDVRRMMALCAERLGTTFVLMTATMPLIVDREDRPELLPSHPDRYEQLARTELHVKLGTPLSVEELAHQVRDSFQSSRDHERRILLVNRRRTAQTLYRHLQDLPVHTAMLSTDLTPLDRKQILDELEDEFILVSTQVIEAGVDISSDVLTREIAPLDSIIQSAGRCNRNFERERGQVEIVRLEDDGSSLATPPYSSFLVESTLDVLEEFTEDDVIDESSFHAMAERYYQIVRDRGSQASAIKHLSAGSINLLDDEKEGLQLITSRPEQSHYIIQTAEDRRIWREYIDIQNMDIDNRSDLIEKKQRFNQIKRKFTERLVNYPTNERPSEEVIPVRPEDDAYHRDVGLQRNMAEAGYEFI